MPVPPRPTFRQGVVALVVVLAGLGTMTWPAVAPDSGPVTGDSVSAHASTRAPFDGIAPTAASRSTDLAPTGRTRTRWIGDLLAVLALVALWTPSVGAWRLHRGSRRSIVRHRTQPALGRAPPAVS